MKTNYASRLILYLLYVICLSSCLGKPDSSPGPGISSPDATSDDNVPPDRLEINSPFEVVPSESENQENTLVSEVNHDAELIITGKIYEYESSAFFRVGNIYVDASATSIRIDDGNLGDLGDGACVEIRGKLQVVNQAHLLTAHRIKIDENDCK